MKSVEEKFEGQEKIPVPHFWGGLRIVPTVIEFWVYICFFLINLLSPCFFGPIDLVQQNEYKGKREVHPTLVHIHRASCMSF